MKPVLIVSGCSITHGAELYNGFMSNENVKRSFSTTLASRMNLELRNVALSGSSNEYIFHSLMSEINRHSDIHSVIAVWTYQSRMYWKNNDRHWFVLPNWASSLSKLEDFEMHDKTVKDVWYTSDNKLMLDELVKIHNFIVLNYFDTAEEVRKLNNYKDSLKAVCSLRGIKLINISVTDLDNRVGNWQKESRHPNLEEHGQIADYIFNTYYREQNDNAI
jgi:hypothetical protein